MHSAYTENVSRTLESKTFGFSFKKKSLVGCIIMQKQDILSPPVAS